MKPIKDFELNYALTEMGKIIDLETGKIKITHTRGNSSDIRVDLYKDGTLMVNIKVIELIIKQYFDVDTMSNYNVTYLDGNNENLSLSNLRITRRPLSYVTKVSEPKPPKIYNLTIDGAIVINKSDIDKVVKINSESSRKRSELKRGNRRKKSQKFFLGN